MDALSFFTIVCVLLVSHFVADFILQSDAVAKDKSKSNKVLAYHVFVYIFFFTAVLVWMPSWFTSIHLSTLALFLAANGVMHFITDYVTSRISSRLWASGRVHDFFVCIGADQLIHQLTLVSTAYLLFT